MRVSTAMLHKTALNELGRVWSRLQGVQSQIATGRRVSKPSDDPIGTDHVLRIRGQLRATAQHTRNLDEAREFADATDAALARLTEVADRIRSVAIRVSDDSYGPEALQGLGGELDGLLEEALTLANSTYAGKRLFGGFQTREEPYQALRDEDGRITGVSTDARGLDGRLQRQVGENVLLTINLTAPDLFGEDLEFFAHAVDLRDAALSGDREAARGLASQAAADLDRLGLAQALTGGLLSRIDGIGDWLSHLTVGLETSRSSYEDLDMAEAALEYQKEQAILQAALSTTTNLMDMSLVHFLK